MALGSEIIASGILLTLLTWHCTHKAAYASAGLLRMSDKVGTDSKANPDVTIPF